MAMWMPCPTPYRLYLVLMLVIPLVCGGTIPQCSNPTPGKQMYKDGKCVDCPQCVPGQFLNKTQEILLNPVLGYLDCYPCQDCPHGKYSNNMTWDDKDGFVCKIHRDCTGQKRRRVVKTAGTNSTNNVCGVCLDGYISEDWPILDIENSYCKLCSIKDKDKQECHGFISAMTSAAPVTSAVTSAAPVTFAAPVNPKDLTTDQHQDPETNNSSIIIGVALGSVIFILILVLVCFWYKCLYQQDNTDAHKENLDSEKGLLANLESDGPSAFSSVSTGVSAGTTTTEASDASVDVKWLTEEEKTMASSIRLKNDDCYVQGVGNADTCPRQKNKRSLAFSLGLPQTQLDEVAENEDEHLISYLNKFIQRKGREATLLILYNALQKEECQVELEALVKILRTNISKGLVPDCTTKGMTALRQPVNKDEEP